MVRFYIPPIIKSGYTNDLMQTEFSFQQQMVKAYKDRNFYIGRELAMIYMAFVRLNDALSQSNGCHFDLDVRDINKVIEANKVYNLRLERFINSVDEDWDMIGYGA